MGDSIPLGGGATINGMTCPTLRDIIDGSIKRRKQNDQECT